MCVGEAEFYLWDKMPSDFHRIMEREDCQPKAIIILIKPMAGEKILANVNHEEKCQKTTLMASYIRSLRWNLHLKQLAKGRFLYNNVLFKSDPLLGTQGHPKDSIEFSTDFQTEDSRLNIKCVAICSKSQEKRDAIVSCLPLSFSSCN